LKIVVDMNLPPSWVGVLEAAGHEAEHWSAIGNPELTSGSLISLDPASSRLRRLPLR
jgi:predicted nuclease of predicted toxin-antitoxin system